MKMNRGNNFMNWPFGRAYLLIGLMLMILLPGAIVYADIIHLKNGNSVEGTVFEQTSDEIKVSMKYGVMSFSREEIASIEKEKPQSAVVPEQDQTQLSSP
ncbi:MAG: hypothetical protein HY920_04100 [Elusimicrobia bacterium]|nr:hypothetical protein [Elusimicrobiota bacterium]